MTTTTVDGDLKAVTHYNENKLCLLRYLARELSASLLDSANFPGSSATCEAVIKPVNA